MADRSTGTTHALDERLLTLLRTLATAHPGARIELVSGYRSPKLNEMLRKKGHHVASHSQHSLGHACDFRIVPEGADRGLDPRVVEREIRKLGWDGGVGVYPTPGDWFVHADVGQSRNWVNPGGRRVANGSTRRTHARHRRIGARARAGPPEFPLACLACQRRIPPARALRSDPAMAGYLPHPVPGGPDNPKTRRRVASRGTRRAIRWGTGGNPSLRFQL